MAVRALPRGFGLKLPGLLDNRALVSLAGDPASESSRANPQHRDQRRRGCARVPGALLLRQGRAGCGPEARSPHDHDAVWSHDGEHDLTGER